MSGLDILSIRIMFFLLLCFSTIQENIYASTHNHYKIGIAFSGTDKYDRSTQQIINGILIAKLFFEKKHPDYQIEIVRYSFRPNDLKNVAEISNRICSDKIQVVIGGEMSEDALMLGNILNACHIVLVSPTATNPKVSENRPYVFRVSASDEDVAKELADFTYHHFKSPIIGMIDDVSLPYPDFLSKAFLNNYSRISHNSIVVKKVLRENVDYSTEIDDFIKRHVNIVVMLTYDIDLKRFLSQAAKKNYFPIYIGSDGWGSNESIVKMIRADSSYRKQFIGYRNDYWKNDSSNKLNILFNNLYKSYYHHAPDAWNAIGFDSAWLVFTALLNNPSNSTLDNIKDRITNTHHLQLVTTNDFKFKVDNSPVKDFYIYKITANESSYIATLTGIK